MRSSVRFLVIYRLEELKPEDDSLLICQGWFQKATKLSGKATVDEIVNNYVLCTQLRREKYVSDA